jgi:putative transposase
MDERVKFIARLLDGETMSGLCREFGISRKTGYKIHERYRDCGVEGLTDRSRRPYRHANQLPFQIETLIVRLKRERPAWGAPKIRERLARLYPDVQRPAISTVHAVLDRHGLVKRRKRRRNRAMGTPLSSSSEPNALWCADYKGTVGSFVLRPSASLSDEPFAEHDGELGPGLEPFARRPLPLVGLAIEDQI